MFPAPISERPRIEALNVASDLTTVAGNSVVALGQIAEAVARARKLGDLPLLEKALQTEGRAWLLARDPARATVSFQEALDLSRRHGVDPHQPAHLWTMSRTPVLLSNLGVATLMGGDAHGAVILHEEAQALLEAQAFAYLQAANTITLADAIRETGDLVRAEQLYREGLRLGLEQHEQRNVAVALAGCAALAAAREQFTQAARLCAAASATLERLGSSLSSGGQLSYEAAETMARAALGDAGYETAWREGHTLTVEEAVEHAFDSPFADPHTRTLLPSAVSSKCESLTLREQEVLTLLASGQTNQQIADALFISRRTVTNHVASVLSKLGVPSRAAAASYAVRNGLA